MNFFLSSYTPVLILILFAALFWSCERKSRNPLPEEYLDKAEIPGMPQIRDWGSHKSEYFQKDIEDAFRRYIELLPEGTEVKDAEYNILAISGGGSNGAFGTGILNGWDASGTKPVFAIVTGISTGALIAPYAFLGGKYDEEIGRLFTSVNTDDIFKRKSFFSIVWGLINGTDSIADSSPLAGLLAQHIDQRMLDDIAKAHSDGRRLYVATTNLDARKITVWNMGALAASGHPKSLELFRSVILASCSMPVAFPAVYIDVEAEGKMYDEMHVDGGVRTEVFFYGNIFDIDEAAENIGIERRYDGRLFIIRNNQFEVQYDEVEMDLLSIAGRSMSSLTSTQGIGDLYRIYAVTQREGIEFNLASIPADFEPNAQEAFDPVEMKRLYDLGYEMALNGFPWEKLPPMYKE